MKQATLLFVVNGEGDSDFQKLTVKGFQQIDKLAGEIYSIVGKESNLQIVSSPEQTAMMTAWMIAKRLGCPIDFIGKEKELRSMDIFNKVEAEKLFSSFPEGELGYAYHSNYKFESGEFIEKRSKIQERFIMYLLELYERFQKENNFPEFVVSVSHQEVLWKLVALYGEPLMHGEMIKMHLASEKGKDIFIEITFRGEVIKEFFCESPHKLFAKQFF